MKRKDSCFSYRYQRGFTLIEMMVAVLIVSIMISIIVPHLLSAGTRAQATASTQNERTIRAAIEEYYLIHHEMPSGNTQQQLQVLVADKLLDSVPDSEGGTVYQIEDTDTFNVVVTTVNGSVNNA